MKDDAKSFALQCLVALCAFMATLLLAGCETTRTVERVVTVQVPIIKPCIENVPERPAYRSGRGDYPGEKDAAAVVISDLEKAEQYGEAWEAAAAGCLVVPAAKP